MSLLHPASAATAYSTGFLPDERDYTVRSILGKASRAGSDIGEVLATVASVPEKDHQAWFDAWIALGRRIHGIADHSAAAGHRVSAARAYLRAANYFAVAMDGIDSLDDGEAELLPTFRAHRAAWDGFVSTTPWDAEPVAIAYEDDSLPGYLFRPDASGAPRPTLVLVNGSDSALSGLWCGAAEGGLQRGYNVLLFDGPGQQSMLFERKVPFRPDWAPVLTSVVDYLLARSDVDGSRLAGYAISQGGYWLPQALATENRFAAAIADGGVVDVGRSWTSNIPHPVLAAYLKGDTAKFDSEMKFGFELPGGKKAAQTWAFRARPYGGSTAGGYAATLDEVLKYDLTGVAGKITTPLYITDSADEQFFPGQSKELAALVAGSVLVEFTAEEGARFHCQPTARELTEQRMYDWLDETIANRST
jgi:hypothetical protein